MNKNSTIDYIMDDPRESIRLQLKVDPSAWVQRYLTRHIRPGVHVLSVGCGPGVKLRALSAMHPTVRATGIDISTDRVNEAIQRNRGNENVSFVRGDAHAMQFPANNFDVVYTRFLLQYVKQKEETVAEMARVCKPGGVVLLQDLDGQLLWHYPEDPEVQRTAEKVVSALAETGFDPFVGRKLFWLARKAGLKNIDVQVEGYHLIAGQAAPEILMQWELKLEIALPRMTQVLGSANEAKEQTRKFLEYLKRPDTLSYSTVFTITGEKPA